MSVLEKQKAIDELIEKATGALARKAHFEAERMALKALHIARQIEDFERMIAAVNPLQRARQQRVKTATAARKVKIVAEPVTETTKIRPGCFLVQPPQVGADARRLRLAALHGEVPVAVVCREPLTKLKQWPVVAIGAGFTVRARIEPPKDQSKPDMKWFIGAMEQLGDWAAQTIDPTLEPVRRLDVVMERLDAIPEHSGLHELLIEICREAMEVVERSQKDSPRKRSKANLST